MLLGLFGKTIWTFTLTFFFFAYYFGSAAVTAALEVVPQFIFDGMGIAAGILPAMGFAMLMRMILNKQLVPYFILGFALTAYLNLPVLGVAILSIVLAIEKLDLLNLNNGNNLAVASAGGDDDDDF